MRESGVIVADAPGLVGSSSAGGSVTNPHDSDRSREPNDGTGPGPQADAAVILGELVTPEYDGLPVEPLPVIGITAASLSRSRPRGILDAILPPTPVIGHLSSEAL